MAVCSRRCADKAHALGQTRLPLMLEFGRCVRHPLTPWLHLGDIRLVFQGIGGCRCTQPVYESRNLYPCSSGVVPYHRIGAVGADPCTRCAAAHWVEEGSRAVLLIMAANAYRILLPSEPPRLPAFCTDIGVVQLGLDLGDVGLLSEQTGKTLSAPIGILLPCNLACPR
jgi:hypothetical protein